MRQHILPVLSLKHFVDRNGRVWTYDKDTKKHWSAIPEESGAETHYYSFEREDGTMDTSIEDFFSEIENAAAPVYEKLATGELPKGTEREAFSGFLAAMYVRTPRMRRMAAETCKRQLEIQMAATASHPGAFNTLLKRFARDGIDVSDPDFIRNSLLDMSHSDLLLPKKYVLRVIANIPELAELFYKMKWSLMRAERHFFITCDNPIYRAVDPKTRHPIRGDYGLLNKTAEITFPISPKRVLLMHWEQEAPRECVLPLQWVENENRKRVRCAERQVFAHLEHKKLARQVAKFTQKTPLVRSAGFQDSKGFGDVKVPRKWASDEKRKAIGAQEKGSP